MNHQNRRYILEFADEKEIPLVDGSICFAGFDNALCYINRLKADPFGPDWPHHGASWALRDMNPVNKENKPMTVDVYFGKLQHETEEGEEYATVSWGSFIEENDGTSEEFTIFTGTPIRSSGTSGFFN